jgi:hypothetical protein
MPTGSYLTSLQFSDTPSPSGAASWTPVASIIDLKPPKIESTDLDTTVLDSPDMFETALPGWGKSGEATVKIQFEKTQQAALYGLFRTPKGFRIVFPDGTSPTTGSTLAWPGWINGFQNAVEKKDIITAEITVKVNGKPAFTPGT